MECGKWEVLVTQWRLKKCSYSIIYPLISLTHFLLQTFQHSMDALGMEFLHQGNLLYM